MGITLSNIDNWLWIRYERNDNLNKNIVSGSDSPIFRWMEMKKTQSQGGKNYTTNIWGSQKRTSSRSSQATHDRNKNDTSADRLTFIHNMIPNFDDVRVEREAMLSSGSNIGSFLDDLRADVDQSVKSMETDILGYIYGTGKGTGQIGVVKSVNSSAKTAVLTDDTIAQIVETGQVVEFAAAKYDGSTDARRVAGTAKVHQIEKYDPYTKTITFSTFPTGLEATDIMWKEGDYLLSNASKQHTGILDYIPASVSAGENFHNIDRSKYPGRLRGRYATVTNASAGDDSGEKIYNALVDQVINVSKVFPKFMVDKIVANPDVMGKLQKSEIFKKGVRWIESETEMKRSGTIGFSAFNVLSTKGNIPMVFDPHCPEGEILGVNSNAWKLKYLSEEKG